MASFLISFRSFSSRLVVKCFLGINMLIHLYQIKIKNPLDGLLILMYA